MTVLFCTMTYPHAKLKSIQIWTLSQLKSANPTTQHQESRVAVLINKSVITDKLGKCLWTHITNITIKPLIQYLLARNHWTQHVFETLRNILPQSWIPNTQTLLSSCTDGAIHPNDKQCYATSWTSHLRTYYQALTHVWGHGSIHLIWWSIIWHQPVITNYLAT